MSCSSELKARAQFTPDFHKLRLQENILVFVYDNFKAGYPQEGVMKGGKYLGRGRTTTDSYVMKKDTVPVVFAQKKRDYNSGHIYGDVFSVSPMNVLFMDKKKNNGRVFVRTKKPITLLDQDSPLKNGRNINTMCHMYLGDPDWWSGNTQLVFEKLSMTADTKRKYYSYFTPIPFQASYANSIWSGFDDDGYWYPNRDV